MSAIEDELERTDRVIIASEDWAKNYVKNPEALAKLIKHEAKLMRAMRKYFRTFAKERLSNYINWNLYAAKQVKAYSFEVIVDIDEIDDEEVTIMLNAAHDPLLESLALGAETAEAQYGIDLGLNKYSESVMKATQKYVAELVKGVNNTTKDRIQQSIGTSIRLGENTESAIARLQSVISDPRRAELIARTESVRSYSKGITLFGRESGATRKIWEISSDPCPICADNEGAIVGIDEDFPSGDSEPPAHPNCRCGVSLDSDDY